MTPYSGKRGGRRASLRYGVLWIAENDEPWDLDPESISGYISTLLLADLFGREPLVVAEMIVRKRKQLGATGEA